ncbi:MAG: VanZ family protein [Lachnospiraceae bacterium]|nr:VanZ family protein [Lachnospiraceae bacterium]
MMDLWNKITNNFLRFFPAAFLISLALTLLYRKILRKDRWVPFFFFCIYLVLLIGETVWGRLGQNIVTKDFIGIGSLFEDPWYMAAAVENVIMFLPFGFLSVNAFPAEKAWKRHLAGAAFMSGCIELAQYALHIGEAQVVDISANVLGAVLGILLQNIFTMMAKKPARF